MRYLGQSRVLGYVCKRHFLCQAEDGIRDLVRSRGLGDVYKRQGLMAEVKSASNLVPLL